MAASKTRVAPLVSTSIPHLELMGAVLSMKLATTIAGTLNLKEIIFPIGQIIVMSHLVDKGL